ncbi:MAG: hypothetical protein JNL81_10230 [Hyphomonadaceae bacterium]|nr:hypothetical protein [Hyphomonadaceae bacterium]
MGDQPSEKELREEVRACVWRLVKAAFQSPSEIGQSVWDIAYDSPALSKLEAFGRSELDRALRSQRDEEKQWKERTDCDRLDAAFAELDATGIAARQDFLCCQTCGVAAMPEEFERMKQAGQEPRGYIFYHGQDTERGVEGMGVYLSFGHVTFDEDERAVAIAREVVAVLQRHGLKPDWDGTFGQRILLPLTWRRRFSSAPA